MAKRRLGGGGPGMMGQAGILKRMQNLQQELLKAQEEATALTVTASAGGGAVTVTVSGDRRLQSIVIRPEVVDPEDVEMLQDLIVAAVNQGLEQVEQEAAARMNAVTADLGIDLGSLGLG